MRQQAIPLISTAISLLLDCSDAFSNYATRSNRMQTPFCSVSHDQADDNDVPIIVADFQNDDLKRFLCDYGSFARKYVNFVNKDDFSDFNNELLVLNTDSFQNGYLNYIDKVNLVLGV